MYETPSTLSLSSHRMLGSPIAGDDSAAHHTGVEIAYERADSIQGLYRQLTHALAILSSAAELTLNQDGEAAQKVRIWLQPSARKAEEALHRLRELRVAQSSAVTDLVQSLTVLVLAADMIAHGQIVGDLATDAYALMRRNAERAMMCLSELRSMTDE
jgi:hypothetical protein